MNKKKYVSWRRVSTFKQGKSGLGLEAQRDIIRYFIEREDGDWIADYAECYTGKELSGCKELRKAMNYAKEQDAVLIIAKSDRFRNTAEALQIYEEMGEGGLMFCDLPHTDKFTLTLFFALAEREALIVSIRTKQALAVKKAQGARLGASNEKYMAKFKIKTYDQKHLEGMKKGKTKNARYLESRDVQVFVKILRAVFPDATQADRLEDWEWGKLTTANGTRQRVLSMMRDYRDIDDTHTLFAKWDLDDIEDVRLQVKLATAYKNLHRAVKKQMEFIEATNYNN